MRWPPRIKCTSIGLNHCCRRCSYCDCRIPCCVVQTINYSNLLKDPWLNHSYSKTVTMSFKRTLTIQLSTTHIFQHIESNQLTTATQHTDAWFNHCMTKPINAYAIFECVCVREKKTWLTKQSLTPNGNIVWSSTSKTRCEIQRAREG